VVGFTFLGYGGRVSHPLTQVHPFARSVGKSVAVLMVRTPSDFHGELMGASAMSVDGITWQPIPDGVRVTGSKFALECAALSAMRHRLILAPTKWRRVRRAGTPLPQYLRARDKACARGYGTGRRAPDG
jgi:hypothetical protein